MKHGAMSGWVVRLAGLVATACWLAAAGAAGVEARLAVAVASGGGDVFGFEEKRPAVERGRRKTEAGAERERIGVAQIGLFDAFKAKAGIQ